MSYQLSTRHNQEDKKSTAEFQFFFFKMKDREKNGEKNVTKKEREEMKGR